ncbi:ADP-heptose:LPS heptosyltransferase [Elusimicrobium simillimum]|uniref:glycosyltransferase family 9 protein n=1 Tax=Elusimicrobium simillimum TaxID=3143438 RepID=UPI003C702C4C
MQKKFLLIRTDRIGDLISITPAISVLRRNFPHAYIAVLVSRYAADVVKNNPEIDEVIIKESFFKTLSIIRSKKFNTAVIFFLDAYAALLTFFARIPLRIGPVSKIWAIFLNKGIRQNRSKVTRHEADFNMELLKPLFVYFHPAKPKIYVPKKDDIRAKNYLKDNFAIDRFDTLIMVHPGSKGSAQNWPSSNYAQLIRRIMQNCPEVKVMLTGSPQEQPMLEAIAADAAPYKPMILKDSVELSDFIALINQCTFFVSNSTGPLHIAVALGKKTLSFYPNLKGCLPTRWGPYGKGHQVLMPEAVCQSKEDVSHMSLITVDQAFDGITTLIKERK